MGNPHGAKYLMRDLINIWKIKRNANPSYIVFMLTNILNVLENTYSVSGISQIQSAVSEIAKTGAGTIFIEAGMHEITETINIDNGDSVIIYGHGDNTILQATDGIPIFNITNAASVIIKNIKLDVNKYTFLHPNTQAIIINETSNNIIALENVTIDGDGNNGIGMELQSNECIIEHCKITDLKKGIHVNNSDGHVITENILTGHSKHGIHLYSSEHSLLSGNSCQNNDTGIYIDTCNHNKVSDNICKNNSLNGIYMTGSSQNTLEANLCEENDSNTANPQAGIYIDDNSDNNNIIDNTSINNNNSGAGNGHGIYIGNANCDKNILEANNCTGNDIEWKDLGTNTSIIYRVSTVNELQDAIDSIGNGTGTIILTAGNISITIAVDFDGAGSYIIRGQGANTNLIPIAGTTVFNITNAASVLIEDLKITTTSYTADTDIAIDINETNNNKVVINNMTIKGDKTLHGGAPPNKPYGTGIRISSQNVYINKCEIEAVGRGIEVKSLAGTLLGCYITNNSITYIQDYGIYVGTGSVWFCSIESNYIVSCSTCIYLENTKWGSITNNYIADCYYMIYAMPTAGAVDGWRITNNTFILTVTGSFYFDGVINTIVQINIFDNLDVWSDSTDYYTIHLKQNCDKNKFIGNHFIKQTNIGVGTVTVFYIEDNTSDDNILGLNTFENCDIEKVDNGTGTIQLADDTAYGAGWAGDKGTATKGALYNQIKLLALATHNHNLADLAEKLHASLTGVSADQHHPQAHTLTSHSTKAHTELTGVLANQHHTPTVAGDLNHNDLANLNAGDVYEHISQAQKDALHSIVVAGDLNHNDLANLNAGDSYEHITQAQKDALQDALKIKGKTIDDAALGDDKILKYDLATQTWKCENDLTGFAPPIGTIMMYSGVWEDNVTISGWYKCDGNNGTVNLVDKFVRGGTASGATGGSDDAVVVSHKHNIQVGSSVTGAGSFKRAYIDTAWKSDLIQNTGESGIDKNIPAYYTLIFIQRIS